MKGLYFYTLSFFTYPMNKKEIIPQNEHLNNLIEKTIGGFFEIVKKEEDLSNILLKGHLFIENLLEELLAVYDLNKKISLNKSSFHKKIETLSDFYKTTKTLTQTELTHLSFLLPSIYSLNDVRNNLAHNLNFKINEADINKIGINLGSEFILQKYKTGHKNYKDNLLFCLLEIIKKVNSLIYIKINLLKNDKS